MVVASHILDRRAEQLIARLGVPIGTSRESEVRWNCPFCLKEVGREDTKHHMYYNAAKEQFFCHRCSTGGGLVYLLKSQGISISETSTKEIAEWGEVILKLSSMSMTVDSRRDRVEVPSIKYPCKVSKAWRHPEARKYLISRGIDIDQQMFYKLHVGSGSFFDRIFFPTFHPENGGMCFWVARVFPDNARLDKYINPSELMRSYHIFNLDKAIEHDEVIITEGVTSAMAAGRNAVATFGKYATDHQVQKLAERCFSMYTVALDGDAITEAIDLAKRLHERGCPVRIAVLPYKHDPASLSSNEFTECLNQAVEYTETAVVRLYMERVLWGKRRKKRLLRKSSIL